MNKPTDGSGTSKLKIVIQSTGGKWMWGRERECSTDPRQEEEMMSVQMWYFKITADFQICHWGSGSRRCRLGPYNGRRQLNSRRGSALGASTFSLCFSLTQQTIRIRNVALEVTDTYKKEAKQKHKTPDSIGHSKSRRVPPGGSAESPSSRPVPSPWDTRQLAARFEVQTLINCHRCRFEAAQLLKRPLNRQWSEEGGESLDFGQSAGQK